MNEITVDTKKYLSESIKNKLKELLKVGEVILGEGKDVKTLYYEVDYIDCDGSDMDSCFRYEDINEDNYEINEEVWKQFNEFNRREKMETVNNYLVLGALSYASNNNKEVKIKFAGGAETTCFVTVAYFDSDRDLSEINFHIGDNKYSVLSVVSCDLVDEA